jgi:hypothetical protein
VVIIWTTAGVGSTVIMYICCCFWQNILTAGDYTRLGSFCARYSMKECQVVR